MPTVLAIVSGARSAQRLVRVVTAALDAAVAQVSVRQARVLLHEVVGTVEETRVARCVVWGRFDELTACFDE